jgi:tRNA A-37 threonylcarbamoyl transferase component Bud32/tetratricopeptide (TPR) repeat protein
MSTTIEPPAPADPEVRALADVYFQQRDSGRGGIELDELCSHRPDLRREVAYEIASLLRVEEFCFGAAGPPPIPPGGVPGRYEVVSEIGGGGMGDVYIARDIEAGRQVAYKVLKPKLDWELFRNEFDREVQITADIAHPGVVPVYGKVVDAAAKRPAYAMGYVVGQTFDKVIGAADWSGARTPRVTLVGLLRQFLTVCGAVGFAHKKGVTHNDLKGNNVQVAESSGEAFVLDWGLAKRHAGELTADDIRRDLTRLGSLLWHILTGSPAPTTAKQARASPRSLAAVAERATEAGYKSVADLAADVRAWVENRGVSAYRDYWPVRAARWATRRPAVATGLAALVLLALGGLIGWGEVRKSRLQASEQEAKARNEREWRLHNAGVVRLHVFRNLTRRPADRSNAVRMAHAGKTAEEAVESLEAAANEFPDNLAHVFYLGQAYLALAESRLSATPPDVDSAIALEVKAKAVHETLKNALIVTPDGEVNIPGVVGVSFPPGVDHDPLRLVRSLFKTGRWTEALIELERAYPQWAERPTEKAKGGITMFDILGKLNAFKNRSRDDPDLTVAQYDVLHWAFVRAAEMEQSKAPWSSGSNANHPKAMRLADFLAAKPGVADTAVYNAAGIFALAAAEPGIEPAERDRRAARAVGYLRRIAEAGYFRDPVQGTKRRQDLDTHNDLDSIRDRDDFREILRKVTADGR